MDKQILISGTGGCAKEVFTIIEDLEILDQFLGFIEPDFIFEKNETPKIIMDYPVFPYSYVDPDKHSVVLAMGNSLIREKSVKQLPENIEYISLVHPSVIMSKRVEIGEGAIICAGTIITCDIKIGKYCQLNIHTTIGHDCVIGDYFTTGPGVNISGNCIFDDHVYFGISSSVKQGVSITKNVVIGMGAVVTKNISEKGIYIGNPARELKR